MQRTIFLFNHHEQDLLFLLHGLILGFAVYPLCLIFVLPLNMETIRNRVEEALSTIRPYLEADGGDVEIIEISADNIVKLELKGACKTCNMSHMTMKAGIEETIRRAVPEVKQIVAVNP